MRHRDLSPEEAKLWQRVANTTKRYSTQTTSDVTTDHDPNVSTAQNSALPPTKLPLLPTLSQLPLKRTKSKRVPDLQPRLNVQERKKAPIADASGHKKVRRGKLEIDARIDLHGMRQIEAQTALADIVSRTRALNGRCILVVTGKGMPIDPGEDFITPQPGVLRRRLPEWLGGLGIREHVSGYASAHAKDGGTGAFYVLLKSTPKLA
jgi:DNA-nicking Smr family endonuclease